MSQLPLVAVVCLWLGCLSSVHATVSNSYRIVTFSSRAQLEPKVPEDPLESEVAPVLQEPQDKVECRE